MNSLYGSYNLIFDRYDNEYRSVKVYSKKNELRYKVFEEKTGRTIKGHIDLNNHSQKEVIDYIRRCRTKFSEEKGLTFQLDIDPQLMPFAKEQIDLTKLKIYCLRRIQKWKLRDQVVSVLRKGKDLFYEVLDKRSGYILKKPIDLENKEIDSVISNLSKCLPKISETGSVSFVPKIASLMVPGKREDFLIPEEKENLSATIPHLRRWIFDNKEISLIRRENELVYEIFDNLTGKLTEDPINLKGQVIEDVIDNLCHCYPRVSKRRSVAFISGSESFSLRKEWSFRNKTLSLLEKNEELFWELYDESTKTYSRTPFLSSYLYWNKMAKNYYVDPSKPISMLFLALKRHYKLDDCLSLLGQCDIEKIEMELTPYSSAHHLRAVYAKKIVKPSAMDPSVIIDDCSWAVTFINSSMNQASNSWEDHTAIIIESIQDGKPFIYKTQLRMVEGDTKISLEKIEEEDIFYSQKGKTWEIASWDIEKMLEGIRWEIRQEELKEPQVFFDINGSESKLVKPVAVMEYRSYQELIEKTLKDSSYLGHTNQRAIIVQDRKKYKKRITEDGQDLYWSAPEFIGRFFVQSPTEDKWTEYVMPDNCLTWAKRKLSDWCGVHFQGNFPDAVYTLPRNYMNRGLKDKDRQDKMIKTPQKYLVNDYLPLLIATIEGNINEVRDCLKYTVNLSSRNHGNYGYNALHIACELCHTKIAELLLEKGMNPNEPTTDENGSIHTPLALACLEENKDLIKLLLQSGAEINHIYGSKKETVLHYAVRKCKTIPLIKLLIDRGADVNAKTESGETPLEIAVKNQEIEIARLLLIHGARKNRIKILKYACENGDIDMIRLLIEQDFKWQNIIRHIYSFYGYIKGWRSKQNNELADFFQKFLDEQKAKYSNELSSYDILELNLYPFDENCKEFGKISIYSKNNELRYKVVFNKKKYKTIKGPIDLNNHPQEMVIDYFQHCRPQFSEKEGLTFKPRVPSHLMPFDKEPKTDPEELKIYFLRYVQRWVLRDHVVSVLRKENGLCYEVLAKKSGHVSKGTIDLDNKEIDSAISYLSQCQPKISGTGTISFESKTATLMVPGSRGYSFTPEETENLSLTMPHISRWIFDDKEISLVRRENVLVYEIFDNSTGRLTEGPIDLDGNEITDDVISYLSHCYPEVSEDGAIAFSSGSEGSSLLYEWSFRNKTLSLLEKNGQFFWELYDKDTKTYSRAPLVSCYLYWNQMAENYYVDPSTPISMLFLSRKRHYKQDDILGLLRECDIEKMEMALTPYSSAHRLKAVYAKKIVKPSLLDPSVVIDNCSWAVTLINSGRSQTSNPLTWGGHAAILIEGRKNGIFFIYKTHLRETERGTKISLAQIPEEGIFYSQKGKTWKIASWDLEKMINAIRWEIGQEELNKPRVFFDINGSDSKFVDPVKIIEYPNYEFLINETLTRGLSRYLSPEYQNAIFIQDKKGNKKRITKEGEDSFWSAPDFIGRFFVQSPSEDKWTEYVMPDNCLTWAKRKLSDWCGVHFEGNLIDAVYAMPRNYMNRELGIMDPDLSDRDIKMNKEYHQGVNSTPLKIAILEGNINKVRYLLKQKVDLSQREYGQNVLHTACEKGLTRIVKLLLEAGMNPNEQTTSEIGPNYTPLAFACLKENEGLIKLLIKSGARINQAYESNRETVLHYAVGVCKTLPLIKFLIQQGADINAKTESGETPLDLAIKNQELEIARLLLIQGARIEGLKMLKCACENPDIDMLRLLVERDFDWKDVIKDSYTFKKFI